MQGLTGARVLVTGASGFIGTSLLDRLARGPVELHAVSRRPPASPNGRIRWWAGDLADLDVTRRLLRDVRPHVIFHLASHVAGARDRGLIHSTFASNLVTTVNLLTEAAEVGCRRILATGSLEEPGPEEVPCSPYAAAKSAASAYARMFHALWGLPVVLLRVFMVYGPRQRDLRKLIPYVILSLLRGEAPKLTSGDREVDWIFVDDVVDALVAAATTPGIEGETLDVGSGQLLTVRHVVQHLVNLIDPRIAPQFGAIADRPLERVRVADMATTRKRIQWSPSTTLEEGLKRTIAWYAEQTAEVTP